MESKQDILNTIKQLNPITYFELLEAEKKRILKLDFLVYMKEDAEKEYKNEHEILSALTPDVQNVLSSIKQINYYTYLETLKLPEIKTLDLNFYLYLEKKIIIFSPKSNSYKDTIQKEQDDDSFCEKLKFEKNNYVEPKSVIEEYKKIKNFRPDAEQVYQELLESEDYTRLQNPQNINDVIDYIKMLNPNFDISLEIKLRSQEEKYPTGNHYWYPTGLNEKAIILGIRNINHFFEAMIKNTDLKAKRFAGYKPLSPFKSLPIVKTPTQVKQKFIRNFFINQRMHIVFLLGLSALRSNIKKKEENLELYNQMNNNIENFIKNLRNILPKREKINITLDFNNLIKDKAVSNYMEILGLDNSKNYLKYLNERKVKIIEDELNQKLEKKKLQNEQENIYYKNREKQWNNEFEEFNDKKSKQKPFYKSPYFYIPTGLGVAALIYYYLQKYGYLKKVN